VRRVLGSRLAQLAGATGVHLDRSDVYDVIEAIRPGVTTGEVAKYRPGPES